MTESDAWQLIEHHAVAADLTIGRSMSIRILRRTLAKEFHPRRATDAGELMGKLNSALDVIDAARDQRELLGQSAPEDPANREPTAPPKRYEPWQTEPGESTRIEFNDFRDLNYIRKTIHERASRFGAVELVKAWAWNGKRFRKVVSAFANEFAYDDLARALLVYLGQEEAKTCDGVFLTHGGGKADEFRLVLIRIGRSYEDVSRYGLTFECAADDPRLHTFLPAWLRLIIGQLRKDQSDAWR